MPEEDTNGDAWRSPGSSRPLGRRIRAAAPWAVGLILVLGIPALFPGLVRRAAPLLLYHPARLSPERSAPAAWGLARGEEVRLRSEDGPLLHGWWIPAAASRACGTLLYLHGNAGNVAGRAGMVADLSRRGLDVLIVDYRGFGRSEGRPTEEGLYRDAARAYRHLREERGVRPGEIVVAGHSLGGAVAAHLAAHRPVGAVVLTSTFTDLSEAARAVYPWLPSAWFDWEPVPFPTRQRVARIDAPVLVGRGGRDALIPRSQVRAVYRAARQPRSWIEVPEADHGSLWLHPEFQAALLEFLREHLPGCPRGPRPGGGG